MTLGAYRHRHGVWPTEVHLSPVAFSALRDSFDEGNWAILTSKLKLVQTGDNSPRVLRATNGADKSVDYWDGIEAEWESQPVQDWLWVKTRFHPD
jgi:hypothetical protein